MIPRCGPSISAGRTGERKVMATTRQPGAACFTSCGLEHTSQRLIEAEATASIGAEPGDHGPAPATQPKGHRPRALNTRVGRGTSRSRRFGPGVASGASLRQPAPAPCALSKGVAEERCRSACVAASFVSQRFGLVRHGVVLQQAYDLHAAAQRLVSTAKTKAGRSGSPRLQTRTYRQQRRVPPAWHAGDSAPAGPWTHRTARYADCTR